MKEFRIGIIGLSPGNGHPYSWAAIFNGYDKKGMAKCPFPVIPEYLAKEPPEAFGIEGAKVTHIWTQDRETSRSVAGASLIENIAGNMTDLIGKVDAVVLARDDGENHLKMAKPFIEAGMPIFIDKPLTDQEDDLREFVKYYEQGKPLMSCSSMRYGRAILELKEKIRAGAKDSPGRILTASAAIMKYWRTYGIHIIEAVCAIMGGGIESVQNVGRKNEEIVHMSYADGRHAVLQTFGKLGGGGVSFFGEKGAAVLQDSDAFFQFKKMLEHFVQMLRTGKPQIDWHETAEMSKIVIAGQLSLEEGGRVVRLDEIA